MKKVIFRVSIGLNADILRSVVQRAIIDRNTGATLDVAPNPDPVDIGGDFEITLPVEADAVDVKRFIETMSVGHVPVTIAIGQFDEDKSVLADLDAKDKGLVSLAPWETPEDVKAKLDKVKAKVSDVGGD
jgi:hypothetical protein